MIELINNQSLSLLSQIIEPGSSELNPKTFPKSPATLSSFSKNEIETSLNWREPSKKIKSEYKSIELTSHKRKLGSKYFNI